MTNEELDEILTSLNANMETASVMRHLRAENEKLRENNDYLRSEKERLGKDVYNLIVKKDEARAENEKLREALKPFASIETLFCDSDEMEFELWFLVKADGTNDNPKIKIGDLRAAAAAIRESGE